jgi:uncharacterized protein
MPCVALVVHPTRRHRRRWRRDVLLGFGLIPISLAIIVTGISISSYIVFGTTEAPTLLQPLPLLPTPYGGPHLPPRVGVHRRDDVQRLPGTAHSVLSGSTAVAVALVAFPASFQHALQPLTFDSDFMLYRLLAPIPFTTFNTLVYLRVRRLLPFAIAHWLMNAGDVFVTLLVPLIR